MSTKTKRQSLSTIESSVTRLLVSTKHLLESLTQWARREVDDKFVSDAYVKLGNDFRASSRAFTNAGVDIGDLGDVPQALRIILEAALSEPPCQENLDKFLPNIRNIIVTLLQNLKIKQSKIKALTQEKEREVEKEKEKERERILERDRERERQTQREQGRGDNHKEDAPGRSTPTSTRASASFRNSSSSRISVPTITANNISANLASLNQSIKNDALAQLQKGDSLQRRASKRFSAYQYAKLTNNQPTLSAMSNSNSEKKHHTLEVPQDISLGDMDLDTVKGDMVNEPSNNTSICIFLRIQNRTKKVSVDLPVTFNSLRLLFIEKFAYSPGTSQFPDIYIQNPTNHQITYELEDHLLSVDVKEGSLLLLNETDPQVEKLKGLEGKFEQLSSKVEDVSNHLVSEMREMVKGVDISPETIALIVSQIPSPALTSKDIENKAVSKPKVSSSEVAELNSIQQELKDIRQLQSRSKSTLTSTIEEIICSLSDLKSSTISTYKTSNRTYMDSCHSKLSEESDLLLTKVDDLQDIMEALRKDVAQRGVRVGEQQLKNTVKEIREAKSRLLTMKDYITTEKVNWKRIWEKELDTVCEEQQFFNLQADLTNDLEDDINRIEETYELIEQCSLEQNKQTGTKRNKFMAQLYIPEPGESLHSMKDAVLNEVAALRPNHESRLEAIEKAERLREREREMMKLTKFQAELEDFVDDSKLKKSGGLKRLKD